MTERIIYIAEDGKAFEDYDECRRYEMNHLLENVRVYDREGKEIDLEEDDNLKNAYYIYLEDNCEDAVSLLYDEFGEDLPYMENTNYFHFNDDEWVDLKQEILDLHEMLDELEEMLFKMENARKGA